MNEYYNGYHAVISVVPRSLHKPPPLPNPRRTDQYLNTWARFLSNLHGPALRSPAAPLPPSLAPFATSWASLDTDQLKWREAVARQIVVDAEEARRPPDPHAYSDWNTMAWVR